jgi:UPF0176 protein
MIPVAAFYRFASVADPEAQSVDLARHLSEAGLRGTVILAREGVNGTLSGEAAALEGGLGRIAALVGELRINRSAAEAPPFRRLRVKVKREIVTMGVAAADPNETVGRHVEPPDWNALILAPDVVVIDTRNRYEVALGSFAGAVDPAIGTFSDFPRWWRDNAAAFEGKRVAMFCTGGIRCEKATSLALQAGARDVFHLAGGILGYLQQVPAEESLWRGECFVFDDRVAVVDATRQGAATMCKACGAPVASGQVCACREGCD